MKVGPVIDVLAELTVKPCGSPQPVVEQVDISEAAITLLAVATDITLLKFW